ncbi:MAG: hypothetical protein R3D29_15500 [Nitratireductor sp.]
MKTKIETCQKKTDPFGIEQHHAALDDTGILHLANAPPTRRVH